MPVSVTRQPALPATRAPAAARTDALHDTLLDPLLGPAAGAIQVDPRATAAPSAIAAATASPAASQQADFAVPSRFRPEAFAAATRARGKRPAALAELDELLTALQNAPDAGARLTALASVQKAARSYAMSAQPDHERTRVCFDLATWADGAAALWGGAT